MDCISFSKLVEPRCDAEKLIETSHATSILEYSTKINNIFLNEFLPSINVPNCSVPKARAMKRGQSANLSTKQNILLDGTFAKTNSGKVY